MQKIILLTILIAMLFSAECFAAIITLKDGSVIEGEIVERTSYYVMIKTGRIPLKYYRELIERIDEDQDFGTNPLGILVRQ